MLLANLTASWTMQWQLFYWPRLRAQSVRLFFLALAFAMGDLALYPLLAPASFANLPMVIWQMIASYQFAGAMALSVILILFIGGLIAIGEILARKWEFGHA